VNTASLSASVICPAGCGEGVPAVPAQYATLPVQKIPAEADPLAIIAPAINKLLANNLNFILILQSKKICIQIRQSNPP